VVRLNALFALFLRKEPPSSSCTGSWVDAIAALVSTIAALVDTIAALVPSRATTFIAALVDTRAAMKVVEK
jgi:hypothetical protein